ncbi:hypothetical protein OEA41_007546 [Lepraria neglecta]|uniref:Uncharacterized protein n=1 Tax=Lepraria neglecta TaxID=209136 RepID=A0AAD9ZCX8_9LECA|nr:hypothetical protein OEA41_007546 [Lepraria neglecta]
MNNTTSDWMRPLLATYATFLQWGPAWGISFDGKKMEEIRAMYGEYRTRLSSTSQPPIEPAVDWGQSQYHGLSNGAQFLPGPSFDQDQPLTHALPRGDQAHWNVQTQPNFPSSGQSHPVDTPSSNNETMAMHPVGESLPINAPISKNNATTPLDNTGHYPLVNTSISSPAPTSTYKKTRDPAKALEKAVENKATEYGFDSDTIKQLRAYANAREKGIEVPEPQEPESQHIIYEFQEVRRQYPIYTTFPDRFPEGTSVKLLPGQTRYDRVGLRDEKILEKRNIQRRTYHDKNCHKWSAAALPPTGSKPLGITKARPVKHNNLITKVPSPVHMPNASISALSNQPSFTPADTTMGQTMGSQPFNFANSTTTPPAMTLNGGYGPSYSTHPIAAPTVMTQTMSNQPFSLAEPRAAPQPVMQTMGNEPSGPATPPATPPTAMQTTGNEPHEQAKPAASHPARRPERVTYNSRGVACKTSSTHIPCRRPEYNPNTSSQEASGLQGATTTTAASPTTTQTVGDEPANVAYPTTSTYADELPDFAEVEDLSPEEMEMTISQLLADGILFLEDAAHQKSQAEAANATTTTTPATLVVNEYVTSFDGLEDGLDMYVMNFDLPSSSFNHHNYYDRIEDFPSANIDAVFAGDELFTSDDLEAAFNGD